MGSGFCVPQKQRGGNREPLPSREKQPVERLGYPLVRWVFPKGAFFRLQ